MRLEDLLLHPEQEMMNILLINSMEMIDGIEVMSSLRVIPALMEIKS